MKKIVRKIVIRYESTNKEENFIINADTSLMKVPRVGEFINIAKQQYLVSKVVTNLNMPNPSPKYPNKVDEFDGVSYYIKIIRKMDNDEKNKKEIDESIRNIYECINSIMELITSISNTNNSNDNVNNESDIDYIKKNIESLKCALSSTATGDEIKQLEKYISELNISVESENGYSMDDISIDLSNIRNTIDDIKDSLDKSKTKTETQYHILSIEREYRIYLDIGNGYNNYAVLGTIPGIKVKTKSVEQGVIYSTGSIANYLDEFTYDQSNQTYKGKEFNNIIIKSNLLETHLKEDNIIDKSSNITSEFIVRKFSISDMVKMSVKYSDSVSIINGTMNNEKYKDKQEILNYCILNK